MNADTKTLEQRARELLAKEYESSGIHSLIVGAKYVRSGENPAVSEDAAIRAIIAALSSAAEAKGELKWLPTESEATDWIYRNGLEGATSINGAIVAIDDARTITLLRAADEADAAGVRTVCRGPALDMEVVREALADALSEAEEMAKVYEGYARGKHFTEWAGKYRAQLAIIDASAPSPETEGK